MKSLIFLFTAALAMGSPLLSVSETHHGNDGSFCTARGYLAYDNPQRDSINDVITHQVMIIRFGSEGIDSAQAVSLPSDFGARWMLCANDRVELGGAVMRYPSLRRCIVKIKDRAMMAGGAECSDDSLANLSKFGEPQTLSIFGPNEAPIRLESSDPDHTYELRRHLSHKSVVNGLEWHEQCEIVQLDAKGTILKRALVYDNLSMEYAD